MPEQIIIHSKIGSLMYRLNNVINAFIYLTKGMSMQIAQVHFNQSNYLTNK